MDPISATANAAAIIGLIDVICRTGKSLYAFFSALKDAPREIKALRDELRGIESILFSIHDYRAEYERTSAAAGHDAGPILSSEIITILKGIHSEYTKLCNATSGTSNSKPGKVEKSARSLEKRINWVIGEKKVSRSYQRLERFKSSLCVFLSTIGRSNDIVLQKQMDVLHEDNINFISQSKVAYNFLDRKLESLDIKADSSLRALHASVAKSTRRTSKALRNLDHSLKERGFPAELILDSNKEVQEKLDSLIASFEEIGFERQVDTDKQQSGWKNDSNTLAQLTLSLMLMKPKLAEAISEMMTRYHNCAVLSRQDANMLQSEFEELLALSHDASANLVRHRSRRAGNKSFLDSQSPTSGTVKNDPRWKRRTLHSNHRYFEQLSDSGKKHSGPRKMYREIQKEFRTGNLSLRVEWDWVRSEPQFSKMQVLFSPYSDTGEMGILASIATSVNASNHCNISRHISSYAVVDYSSPIFQCVADDNIQGVRDLLLLRAASPTDRNPQNESILSYAATHLRTEICELLVNEGADPSNCRSDGANAIYSIRDALWLRPLNCRISNVSASNIERILRTFIKAGCDIDATALGGNLLHFTPFSRASGPEISVAEISYFVDLLLLLGADIEYQNPDGATPLLFNARVQDLPGIVLLRQLLLLGANPHSVTRFSEGPLHIALAFEAMSPGRDDASLLDRLSLLLQAGCSPFLLDSGGHSPCDFALHSPTVWLQWCLAVESSGVASMEDILAVGDTPSTQKDPKATDSDPDPDSDSEWESCSSGSSEDGTNFNNSNDDNDHDTFYEGKYPHCTDLSHIFVSFGNYFPWSCDPLCHDCGLKCIPRDAVRRKRAAWELVKAFRERKHIYLDPDL